MMKILAAAVIVILMSSAVASANPSNVKIKLNINSTEHTVYVPGTGAMPSGSAESYWTSPAHNYLASYLGNTLFGLVFVNQNPIRLAVSQITGGHSLDITAGAGNSNILLAFTSGDWRAINNMMPMIEFGNFFSHMYPSFSHGLGTTNDIKILTDYSGNIDLTNELILNPGQRGLRIESVNETGEVGIRITLI